jgi:hypothetical protein
MAEQYGSVVAHAEQLLIERSGNKRVECLDTLKHRCFAALKYPIIVR